MKTKYKQIFTLLVMIVVAVGCQSQNTETPQAATQVLDKKAQDIAAKYGVKLDASEPNTSQNARTTKTNATLVVKSKEEFEAVMKQAGMIKRRGEALDKNTQAMLDELAGVTDQEKRKIISDKYERMQEEILKRYP